MEKSLPPLVGIGALIDASVTKEGAAAAIESGPWFSFRRPWVVISCSVVLALGLGSMLILRRN